jgi:hypothetical protein
MERSMIDLIVKSAVIMWPEQMLEVTDTTSLKHVLPLSSQITVTMVGHPEREEKTMMASSLAYYMRKGFIIEKIRFEEDA